MIGYSDKLASFSQKAISDSKLKINKTDISLTFVMYKKVNGTINFTYSMTIFRYRDIKGSIVTDLKNKDIDLASLKKAILDQLSDKDKKYIEIFSFTTKRVEFKLKEEWFKDAMHNLTPYKTYNIFKKDFKLKIDPPLMVRTTCVNSKLWNDLVVEKLGKYMTNNDIKKNFSFFNLIKKTFSFSTYFSLFDWSYSPIYNVVEGNMKAKWVVLLMFGAANILQKR